MGVLRNARIGIVGGVILGLGRALGETMAVTMVIGNRPEVAKSLFAPGYTMASVIANEFSEATGDLYLSALVEIGLALFIVTLIVNALARLLVWSITRGRTRGPMPSSRQPQLQAVSLWRRITNQGATAFAIGAAVLVLVPLIAIFIYLVDQRHWLAQLGLPHPDSKAAGRNRRRHGQCDRGFGIDPGDGQR